MLPPWLARRARCFNRFNVKKLHFSDMLPSHTIKPTHSVPGLARTTSHSNALSGAKSKIRRCAISGLDDPGRR
jgi:hypothetical protein